MSLNDDAFYLIDILEKSGFEAFEVGGCVRDRLMNRAFNDIDITTSAKPYELEEILRKNSIKYIETGLKHGTVTAILNGNPFEITTYRVEGEYYDNRHPETVEFVTDISADLSRRDFTVNALAYSPSKGIVDLFGGQEDIQNKIIRAVGDADRRFQEDALRIMRAVRFASVLGFSIEENTKKAIMRNKELLKNVSAERIFAELSKLLMGKNVFHVLLEYRDVIAVIIPELIPCFDCAQNTKWHIYDVYTHICKTVACAPPDSDIRLAMLLHDIGKPQSKTTDEKGVDHFKGHQLVSAEQAKIVLKRLKVSKDTYDRVVQLVAIHDMHIGTKRNKVRRFLHNLGYERLIDLIQVKCADKLGQNPEMIQTELTNLEITRSLADTIIREGEVFRIKDLAVNGNDLKAIGYEGKAVGEALTALLELVMDDRLKNDKQALICKAKEWI